MPSRSRLFVILGLAWFCASPFRALAAGSALASADVHYQQHSYAAALKEYRAALAAGGVPNARRTEIDYRIVVALGSTRQWDEALAANLAFAQAHHGTVWEARGLWSLFRLYQILPRQGYRVGTRVYLGRNVPRTPADSSERRVRVSFAATRLRDEREALEAAHVIYSRVHAPAITEEAIRIDFELANLLAHDETLVNWYLAKNKWPKPADPALTIQPAEEYSVSWPPPKKILSLYAHIRLLARHNPPKPVYVDAPHGRRQLLPGPGAQSLVAESEWLRQYQRTMRDYAVQWDGKRAVPIPYPYQSLDPLAPLRQISRDYPADPLADQAGELIGNALVEDHKFAEAAVEYRRLIAERPKSLFANDCRLALALMHRRTLALSSPGPIYANAPAAIQIDARNTPAVRLQLFRAPLDRWLTDAKRLSDPQFNLSDITATITGPKMRLAVFGRPIADWNRPMPSAGLFNPQVAHASLPVSQSGAYLVVGSTPGYRAAQLVVRTNLVVAARYDRDRVLCFAAESVSGQPVAGANLIARESYQEPGRKQSQVQRVAIVHGVTGADGVASLPIAHRANRSNFETEIIAIRGADIAITSQASSGDYSDNSGRFKTYSTTDRAVYRPSQTVQFREVVFERRKSGMSPAAGRTIHVEAFDPQGKRIYASLLPSGEFGSVHGRFELPANAPLGEYSVKCSVFKVEGSATDNGGSQFRVEEYRKPEFQVTVTPDAGRVRLGQPAAAVVHATYYFGGPAVGAKVTYRVHRNRYAQTYEFPKPFDFLYADQSQGQYDTDFRNGEVVTQGTAATDAKGDARVTFPTKPDETNPKDVDFTYTVEADVKDSSRRTITCAGAIKATRHDVGVFLNYPHGYAHTGDHAAVEIVSLNSADVPIAVEGVARVFRQPAVENAKERLVSEKPLATDTHVRAILDWTPAQAGCYRIAYVTHDTDGAEVEGSTSIWVAGAELSRGDFFTHSITLAAEQPYYQEGQTAKLLIATQKPDCTVLLTREANNQILERRVVRVSGRSAEVAFALGHRDSPNVFIHAVTVRNGELLEASQELFVPPISQLAKVTVTADKAAYQPGEKAAFHLAVTDWQGRPLRTELAVSVSDAALSYIQKSYAPDIRVYYFGDRRSESVQSAGSAGMTFNAIATASTLVFDFKNGLGFLTSQDSARVRAIMPTALPIGTASSTVREYLSLDGAEANGLHGAGGPSTDPWHAVRRNVWSASAALGKAPQELFETDLARIGLGVRFGSRSVDYEGGVGTVGIQLKPPRRVPSSFTLRAYAKEALALPSAPGTPPGLKAEPIIRRQFLDTAFWTPAVITDSAGLASVDVTWPDNLTQWRAYAVGNSAAAQVGTAEASVTTRKDLIIRLETPRYFVERDTMTLSAIVQNNAATESQATVALDLSGDNLDVVGVTSGGQPVANSPGATSPPKSPLSRTAASSLGAGDFLTPTPSRKREGTKTDDSPFPVSAANESGKGVGGLGTVSRVPAPVGVNESGKRVPSGRAGLGAPLPITIPAGGERRIDWQVRVMKPGAVRIRAVAKASSGDASAGDAAEAIVPVLVHGVERSVAASGVLRGGDGTATVPITLPEARKPGASELVVQLNPSLAAVMLDALPYLNDYPYGCVEQTMSRFLPSVLTERILKEQGFRLEDLRRRAEAAERVNADSPNHPITPSPPHPADSPYTYPAGKPGVDPLPVDRTADPVFDSKQLAKMVRAGLDRLRDFQHADGGWGWWKNDASDAWMTAYVVYGLIQAREAGVAVDASRLRRAEAFLAKALRKDADLHEAAFVTRVLSMEPSLRAEMRPIIAGRIYDARDGLSAYSKAHLALALAAVGERDKANVVIGNLENTVQTDVQDGTAHWGEDGDGWWRWYDDPVETTAAVLQAYLAVQPASPMPARIVKWLVDHRQGDDWNSTRSTALTVYALSDYVRQTHEHSPDYTVTVELAGAAKRTYHVTKENALLFDNRFVVPDALLHTGAQPLTITKKGVGACYYSVYTSYFSREESIPAAGHGIFVTRHYYRLIPGTATGAPAPPKIDIDRPNPILAGRYDLLAEPGVEEAPPDTNSGPIYKRTPIADGDTITSGDLIEVELDLEAKNDYRYLAFEDVKPAGCEPVEVRSGEKEGQGICSNFELRDQKVVFFLSAIPQGTRSISYRLRAESPGAFHALPTNGYAMYAPALRTVSAEQTINIKDE